MESNKSNDKSFESSLIEYLRMAFERDDPYSMGESLCFFNKKTIEINWVHIPEENSSVLIKKYQKDPDYIEVPGTDHHEWHEVFKNWLSENNLDELYTTSIGLTLRHIDDIDPDLRYSWGETQSIYADKKARDFLFKYYKPSS